MIDAKLKKHVPATDMSASKRSSMPEIVHDITPISDRVNERSIESDKKVSPAPKSENLTKTLSN